MSLFQRRVTTIALFTVAAILLQLTFLRQAVAAADVTEKKTRPNFVVVLVDDLGYGDLACFGHKTVKTPNLDRFAKEGLRLTNCYAAAANCSPSRCGLMTGRTPYRVGIHNWIPMYSPMHVRKQEITVATLLRQAGYATCHVGKWHLNGQFNKVGQPQPSDHGFDYWFSTQNNALPTHHNPDNFVRNGIPVGKLDGYAAELVVDEAIGWLAEKRDAQKPFFLYVCFHEPHEPIASHKRFTDLYPDTGQRSRYDPSVSSLAAHHGNITQMDHAFGRLMQTLDKLNLDDNTFVLFTSDNGPAITRAHPHGSAGPLRDKKGAVYEGGIRVPGIIRWPGHTKPGQVNDEPISGVDLLPTLCAVTGIPAPNDRVIDGASFLPIFAGRPIERKTPLYWQFNVAHSKPKVAMRIGDWKILASLSGKDVKPYGDIRPEDQQSIKLSELKTFELFHLREDIGETTDRAQSEPKRLREMSAALNKMYHEVRDESPVWPEWKWPRYDGHRINEFVKSLKKSPGVKPKGKKSKQ